MPELYVDVLAACFQMTEHERGTVLRGWKLPAPLLATPTVRQGFNVFTKQVVVSSSRLAPEPTPDPDAVQHPILTDLPWVDTQDFSTDGFVSLAVELLDWSVQDANDELMRFLVGPDLANDAFAVVPNALVRELANVEPTRAASLAESAAKYADLDRAMCDAVVARLIPFTRMALNCGRDVYHWTSR